VTAELYLGLMSGTSMDGIDAVLVDFSGDKQDTIGHFNQPWSSATRQRLFALAHPGDNEIERLGLLDQELGAAFADAALRLLDQTAIRSSQVTAIGCHGQTIRHRPESPFPFTLQIGDPNQIAERTGITVVADFRRRDMAAGGQGAPLVPAYHAAVFGCRHEQRVILNIGGIANITLLPTDGLDAVSGFDTGPGNTLLDGWARRWLGKPFDASGDWAAGGSVRQDLLARMLADPYIQRPPPKSTGPEYFNLDWLANQLRGNSFDPEDVQATLAVFTAECIFRGIAEQAATCERVIACGGGVLNQYLMRQLEKRLSPTPLELSSLYGLDPQLVEASAFAWLARRTILRLSGNLPAATGASHPVILGGVYSAG
jgi:anhydro-N-acetylmuramic acid kinase